LSVGRTGRPARSTLADGLFLGLTAGLLLGLPEALERAFALRGFLRGAGETAGLAGLVLFFPMLVGAGLGLAGGAGVALAGVLARAIPLPAAAWRALWGGALGAATAAWGVFALSLTVRFDPVVARRPLLLAAGLGLGMLAGLAWGWVLRLAGAFRSGRTRAWAGGVLAGSILLLHAENTYYAPASSYGLHVLLETALAALAALTAWMLPRAPLRAAGKWGAWLLLPLAIGSDWAMRTQPRLEGLVKIRTATAARCVDLTSFVLDWDRDGSAPPWLVGGEDAWPLDPGRPPAILGNQVERGAPEPAPAALADSSAGPQGPNILLLTLDACRADVVSRAPGEASLHGTRLPPTPVLDSLAARGARFEAAYAPSAGTEDTFGSLFAGDLLPGLLLGADPRRSLAQRLLRRGYAVKAWVDDPHFAHSDWGFPVIVPVAPAHATKMMLEVAEFLGAFPPARPGFAWVHVMDLHSEVLNPFSADSYSRSRKLRAYARNLGRVDSLVGTLLGALQREGVGSRTLVVVSADHGEEFGEHGHFHHNLSLYEPAIRVPLWISGPGVKPRALGFAVALEDLYPTLLEAAGIAPGATPSHSLWPTLSGAEDGPPQDEIYSFLPIRGFSRRFASGARIERGQAALIDPRSERKVILRLRSETWEAYDLRRDPMERDNLAGDGLAWPDSMLASLRAAIARHGRVP